MDSEKREKKRLSMERINQNIRDLFYDIKASVASRWKMLVNEVGLMRSQRLKRRIIYDVFTKEERQEIIKHFELTASANGHYKIDFARGLEGRYVVSLFDSREDEEIPIKILKEFTEIIKLCFYQSAYFKFSIIYSMENCSRQPLHCDDAKLEEALSENSRIKYDTMSFTMIGSLEDEDNETSLYLETDTGDEKILLPPGSVIIMRGDCRHAGAEYNRFNRRLFMSIGTEQFPNDNYETGGLDPIDKTTPLTIHPADKILDEESDEEPENEDDEDYSPEEEDNYKIPVRKRKAKAQKPLPAKLRK